MPIYILTQFGLQVVKPEVNPKMLFPTKPLYYATARSNGRYMPYEFEVGQTKENRALCSDDLGDNDVIYDLAENIGFNRPVILI